MKKIVLLLIFISIASCGDYYAKKPENLIDAKTMEDIVYDLSILEAIQISNPILLEQKNINPKNYIYKKYKIDSITFAQNYTYYASSIRKYNKLFKNVEKRLEQDKNLAQEKITSSKNANINSTKSISEGAVTN